MKASQFSLIGLILLLASTAYGQNAADIEVVRTKVQEWVKTRQLISAEKADWKAEREALEDTQSLLKSELSQLKDELSKLGDKSTDFDDEIKGLVDEKAQLKEAADYLEREISQLEKIVLDLTKTFPPKLAKNIEKLKTRIPTSKEGAAKRTLGERMLNIVGILSQAEKFDSTITDDGETLVRNGESFQARVLYLGLGAGYYVDQTGTKAGIAQITSEGWKWQEADDVAPALAQIFAIYERTADAEFVSLPAQIQ